MELLSVAKKKKAGIMIEPQDPIAALRVGLMLIRCRFWAFVALRAPEVQREVKLHDCARCSALN